MRWRLNGRGGRKKNGGLRTKRCSSLRGNLQRLRTEYAEPLDFPVQWDTGAPLPQLLVNDYRAFLTFYVRVVDPKWDGSYVTIKSPASDQQESLALVEFKR